MPNIIETNGIELTFCEKCIEPFWALGEIMCPNNCGTKLKTYQMKIDDSKMDPSGERFFIPNTVCNWYIKAITLSTDNGNKLYEKVCDREGGTYSCNSRDCPLLKTVEEADNHANLMQCSGCGKWVNSDKIYEYAQGDLCEECN